METKIKTVSPSAHIMTEFDELTSAQQIELCGRICYKSEDKVTQKSAGKFVKGMVKHRHNSTLEMSPITFRISVAFDSMMDSYSDAHRYYIRKLFEVAPKFLVIDKLDDGEYLISGSVRSFRELVMQYPHLDIGWAIAGDLWSTGLFDDIEPPEFGLSVNISVQRLSLKEIDNLPPHLHLRHRQVAVKFIVNRAVTHEIVRHRPCSFLQESQRYCRYGSGRFGDRVTFIKPMFFPEYSEAYRLWEKAMLKTEQIYLTLVNEKDEDGRNKYTAQAARTVLPNSCKTELIMLANLVEWEHFLYLRCGAPAEPSMREVTIPLREEFRQRFPQHSFDRRMPEGWVAK